MTDQTSAEIVRRLRAYPIPLCAEAASLIEALSAERAGEPDREAIAKLRPVYVSALARGLASDAFDDLEGEPRSEDRTYYLARWFDAALNARALAAESTVARLTSERDEARKQSAARLKVINEKLAERDTARNALRDLIRTAQLLQQNSEGCAVNHHGLDFEEQGLPGWLRDTAKSISAALVAVGQRKDGDQRSGADEPAACNHWPGQRRCGVCGMGGSLIPADETNEVNDAWARGEHIPGVTR
jgi:hypothetical protein